MKLAIDTETTGLDFYHGCKPFFVNMCDEEDNITSWHWRVNPETREPYIRKKHLKEIKERIFSAEELIFQNSLFDILALNTIIPGIMERWPWDKTRDTMISAHMVASGEKKDLTFQSQKYLGIDIQEFETNVEVATKKARNLCRSKYKNFNITRKGDSNQPSAKEKTWKSDMWIPREIAYRENLEEDHLWYRVLEEYANPDPFVTFHIHQIHMKILEERGIADIYFKNRIKLLPVICSMKSTGLTVNYKQYKKIVDQTIVENRKAKITLAGIAKKFNYELEIPKSGNNKSLSNFCYSKDLLNLPIVSQTKTGNASLDDKTLTTLSNELDEKSLQYQFVTSLQKVRKTATSINYLEGYKRHWTKTDSINFKKLHSSLNPTATATLRFSSQNPNQQNISKQEGSSLRLCFGPAEGREWFSFDANNIELRIPAYESGERAIIELFENPYSPPFFGSNHLLVFSILWPSEWKKHGIDCKEVYKSTLYQWVKNGNFAIQYGAMEETADKAYRQVGAYKKVKKRFLELTKLNSYHVNFAEENGYVETIPDKELGLTKGYPLQCPRGFYGVKATIPLNYHVQSTAMYWMTKAMIRCHEYLQYVNSKIDDKNLHYHIIMQVHDELVFDFPKNHKKTKEGSYEFGNLKHLKNIKKLMERGGKDIGIPTSVGCDFHPENWGESFSVKL